MAVRKQRATTQMKYALDTNYDKVLQYAKRIHRNEGIFYIGMVLTSYSSYTKFDLELYPDTEVSEKWTFQNNRWVKEII